MNNFRIDAYKNSPLFQNNPGNLPNKGIDWGGKVLKEFRKGNAKYEEFVAVEYGLRALMRNIRTIMEYNKKNTLSKFAHSFFPAVNTKKVAIYENTLSKALGIDKNKVITYFSKDFYIKMAKAIAGIEMGAAVNHIPTEAYDGAFQLINKEMTSGGNPVMPENKKPVPSTPKKPVPSSPNNSGGNTNIPKEGNQPQTNDNVVPTDPQEGTNWLLWGGVALAVGAGGFLLYDKYGKKSSKKAK